MTPVAVLIRELLAMVTQTLFLATGGVYVAGGIPGRILPRLETGRFLDAFVDKGLLGPVLAEIPVHVITSDRAALLGAARLASE